MQQSHRVTANVSCLDQSSSGRIIIMEGNISAGKSTLAKKLGELLGYRVFMEPTVTNPFLEKFYADPSTWALPMQIWLLRQRFKAYIAASKIVLETGTFLDADAW